MRITVTLARQFGCGGSFLGHALAESLGVRCLDRDILSHAARHLSAEEEDLAAREERGQSFWERMLRGVSVGPPEALYHPPVALSVSDRDLFEAETEVMKTLAAREDCVIVGRLASHVLAGHAGMVNLFLHAPPTFRARRLVETGQAADEAQARDLIARSDETRRRFVTQMVGQDWGDARHYHLCLDTSTLPLPELADLLTDFVRRKTAGR